jgi:hypothetical protein
LRGLSLDFSDAELVAKKADDPAGSAAAERDKMTELRREFLEFQANLRREGKAEGKAEALLAVLTARGVAISDAVRQKILACTDLAALDRLLAAAATAASPSDVLAAATV